MDQRGTDLKLELGDWIVALYDAFYEEYQDHELALIATTATVQEGFLDGSIELAPPRAA